MSSVVEHKLPLLAITRSVSLSAYENFILFKIIATTRCLKWEERKSYWSRSSFVGCRTDIVVMSWDLAGYRCLAKHGDMT